MNKICVYAISKNEEQFVKRWYDSMKEADTIVVLDTGSTDNTVQLLKELGVIVAEQTIIPWRFDVARNEAMKLVPDDCNILISTDLDEILEPGWADILRSEWIEGVHERGHYKYTWSHLPNGQNGRTFYYDKIHSKHWEWRAPVHELLFNTQTNSYEYSEDVVLNLFDKIHLHHYPDETKSRASYLPLLEQRAKEMPNDYYGLIYLSHEYYYRGKYEESIELLKNILLNYKQHYNALEQASCYLFMGDSIYALANQAEGEEKIKLCREAIIVYQEAIDIEPTYRELYLDLGRVLIEIGEYELATCYIKLGLKRSVRHYTWLERDLSWTFEPWDLLCLSSYYSGDKKSAIIYAAKALSYEPDNERLQQNLQLCLDNTELI